MWMNLKPIFTVAAVLLLTACSQLVLQSRPGGETTDDGLVRVDNAALAETYVRPGTNLQDYNAVQLDSIGIDYRSVGSSSSEWYPTAGRNEYDLTPVEKASFEALVNEIFIEEFAASRYFTVADKAGPRVLLLKGSLVDVVSFIPPERAARDFVYLFELGQATLILEAEDSLTGESFFRASERKRVAPNRSRIFFRESNPVTNRQEVRRFVRLWAREFVGELDQLHKQGEIL